MSPDDFYTRGWCQLPFDPVLSAWGKSVLPAARAAAVSDSLSHWLRCGGTWFVGVNALPNNEAGATRESSPLQGEAVELAKSLTHFGEIAWDAGQISICYPGYPQRMEEESEAAFRYRISRDAAHVDGLLPEGPNRRRHLREWHQFILGIPLVDFSQDASPFVVWEGSHEIVRDALQQRLSGVAPADWGQEDITDVYHQARMYIFEHSNRRTIWARPGEAFLVHRLMLHGTAPWHENAVAGSDGRMICFFRPEFIEPADWLFAR